MRGDRAQPRQSGYVADACRRHPDRFQIVADLDCSWSDSYHRPGAPTRLEALCERYTLAGFMHYLSADNYGWLAGEEADAVFPLASQRQLPDRRGAEDRRGV